MADKPTIYTLEEFRKKMKVSYRSLAMLLDIDYSLVFRYCKGERVPSMANAAKIAKKTKGLVPLSSWEGDYIEEQ